MFQTKSIRAPQKMKAALMNPFKSIHGEKRGKSAPKNPTILSQPGFTVNVNALADFSVNLTVRWWVDTTETTTANSISEVQEHVIQAFNQHGISIPYPVQEVKVYRGDQTETEASTAK